MSRQLLTKSRFTTVPRCFALSLFLAATACSDDAGGSEDAEETGSGEGSGASDGTGDPGSSGGAATMGEGSIRGTFVFRDGTEVELDVSASHRRFEIGEVVQHSCEGSDLGAGVSLAVTWRDDTAAGTHAPSLTDGPGFLAAWPLSEGGGVRATLPSGGEMTFERIGTTPGDVVEGTAHAVLRPEPDDPDDRVSEITDIAFRCDVTDAE